MATVATRLALLRSTYDNTLAEIDQIAANPPNTIGSTTYAGGKPDALGPNAVQHTAYEDKLLRRLETLERMIATLDSASTGDTISDGYV